MSLISLPNEILEQIFYYDTISMTELGRLLMTGKRFAFIRESDELWHQKFCLRCCINYSLNCIMKISPCLNISCFPVDGLAYSNIWKTSLIKNPTTGSH